MILVLKAVIVKYYATLSILAAIVYFFFPAYDLSAVLDHSMLRDSTANTVIGWMSRSISQSQRTALQSNTVHSTFSFRKTQ